MALKIDASTLLERIRMEVRSDGVLFSKGAFASSRCFRFRDIQCILLSTQNVLSFQVGNEVCSLLVKPDNPKQKKVIDMLVAETQRAHNQ